MAIDNRAKRAAVLCFAVPWLAAVYDVPDGSISAGDRESLVKLYPGIALRLPADLSTPDRRASSLQESQPWIWTPPKPDGSISQNDRAWLDHLYTGVSYTSSLPSFVNTADKRASVVQLYKPWLWIGFGRDGTIGAGDRAQLAKLYRGYTLETGIPSAINSPIRRASVLQFEMPWVWTPYVPAGASGVPFRQHLTHLYTGIPFTVAAYTAGSATLRVGASATDLDAQNIAYAGNTGRSLNVGFLAISGAGSFSATGNPIAGGGAFRAGVYVLGQGTYLGDNFSGSAALSLPILVSGSGTYSPFTGTSFGSGFGAIGVSVSGVGHYTPPPAGTEDIFSHFMLCNQLTFEETICAIYKSIGQQGAGGTVMGFGGGRAPYFDERSYEKMQELLDFLKRWKPEPSTDRTLERVVERQPIYIQSDGKQPTVIERVIKPAVVVAGPNDDEEAIVHALMMELASDD